MKNKFSLLIFSLVLMFLLGNFVQVLACISWTYQPSVCEMYGKASAVFVGKIINIKEIKHPKSMSEFEIDFQIREAFVGANNSTRVSVILLGASLEYCKFENGKSYLVYAYKGDKGFSIDAGTRTRPVSEATEDLEFLRNLSNKKMASKYTAM